MKLKFSTKEKKCRLCFSKKIEKILDLGNQPLANNLVKEKNYHPPKWLMGNEIWYSPNKKEDKNG